MLIKKTFLSLSNGAILEHEVIKFFPVYSGGVHNSDSMRCLGL